MPTLRFAALPALLFAACITPGERNQTGRCPDGEVCSAKTPNGLSFDGADFYDLLFDNGLHVTAEGGTQGVTIYDPGISDPLRLQFDATTQGVFTVTGQATGAVDLFAQGSGGDFLRIVDPDNGELYDRVEIHAGRVATAELKPDFFGELGTTGRELAIWSGARITMVVALKDADNNRLVDESMTLSSSNGSTNGTWDSIPLVGPGAGELGIDASFAQTESVHFALPVATAVDAITPLPRDRPTLLVHTADLVCFSADAGIRAVVGAPWQFRVAGPASLLDTTLARNCAYVEATDLGTVVVTASVGGVETSVTLTVATSAARFAPALPELSGPTLGERASY